MFNFVSGGSDPDINIKLLETSFLSLPLGHIFFALWRSASKPLLSGEISLPPGLEETDTMSQLV